MPKTHDLSPAHTPWPVVDSPDAPQIPATGSQPSAAVARICPFSVPLAVDRFRADPNDGEKRYGLGACGARIVSRAQPKSDGLKVK